MSERWARYFEGLEGRPPRATTIFAARRFKKPGLLVDLGCGAGRDSLPLLALGWRVIAIDREETAIMKLREQVREDDADRLETNVVRMEDADWPEVDLTISCFALPLAPKPHFPALWARIGERIRLGGRFAGQLYGPRDSWARGGAPDGVVAVPSHALARLFKGFRFESYELEEHDGVTPRGARKHWHIHHIVAQKVADRTAEPDDVAKLLPSEPASS